MEKSVWLIRYCTVLKSSSYVLYQMVSIIRCWLYYTLNMTAGEGSLLQKVERKLMCDKLQMPSNVETMRNKLPMALLLT
jgi:hypothetical protein